MANVAVRMKLKPCTNEAEHKRFIEADTPCSKANQLCYNVRIPKNAILVPNMFEKIVFCMSWDAYKETCL